MNRPWLRLDYAAYGLLGLPLAMAALPVYVHLPAFYALRLDIGLAQLGWVLFAVRLLDTLQDPALGLLVDRINGRLAPWLAAAGAVFGLAFAGLWLPPADTRIAVAWLAAMLALTYCAHSFLNIAYLAWGASLQPGSGDGVARTLLGPAAWREGAGLAGIMLASAIPAAVMAGDDGRQAPGMAWYSAGFALLLALALAALLRAAPAWQRRHSSGAHWQHALRGLRNNRRFLRLLPPYFLNALSVSLPATLALFFIRDQLQAPRQAAGFLLAYFLAAVCGLPLWVRLAGRIGAAPAWGLGMLLAVAAFAGASLLGSGDTAAYFAICVAAGAALGADLALPPVLFAQAVRHGEGMGIHYSVYTLLGKLALAWTGLALPLLARLGYQPGAGGHAALTAMYAGLPCLLKTGALLTLWSLHEKDSD
jgi:GPH family glycoside/pentoside/hexuronide:cation symporter